jgi:transposase-like protein
MSKKRITYPATFKAKVALAAQRQDKTIRQLAAHFKVHPIVISRWKAQLLDQADLIFNDGRTKRRQIADIRRQQNSSAVCKLLSAVSFWRAGVFQQRSGKKNTGVRIEKIGVCRQTPIFSILSPDSCLFIQKSNVD